MISYEHLTELQRFAELGRVSASLLHEISNPLTAALLNLELGDPQSAAIRRARRDIKTLRRYVEAARQQIRRQSQATSFGLRPQLDQVNRLALPLAKKAGVKLTIGTPPKCRLYGDPVKFQHVIANLIINAIEACAYADIDDRREVRVAFESTSDEVIIRVRDHGQGIAAGDLAKIFDTFYTTKHGSGHGLGLGLAIVKQYVTADFKGSIEVASSRRRGTCFSVRIPVSRP